MTKTEELLEAVKEGNLEKVTELLDAGVDVNTKGEYEMSVLVIAISMGINIGIVKLLLDRGAEAGTIDGTGVTPLLWAVGSGKVNVVKLLLDHGIDPNTASEKDECTPLMMATISDSSEIVKILLDAGAKTDTKDEHDRTALMIANSWERTEIIELLSNL